MTRTLSAALILALAGCSTVIPTVVAPENPIPLALTEPCDTGPWSPQTNGELATSYLAAKAALEACAGRLRAVREWPEVPSGSTPVAE